MQDQSIPDDLPKVNANYEPLSPISFLDRSADVHPEKAAIRYQGMTTTYSEMRARCRRLAGALAKHGVKPGDCVSVMAPNVPALLEAHFGVPMAGAILNAINTRLDPETVHYILEHSESKMLIVDKELGQALKPILAELGEKLEIVEVRDRETDDLLSISDVDYEGLLDEGDPEFFRIRLDDEWHSISLNYTSGTTGRPKGVLYHHRGAYLNALGNQQTWSLPQHPVYLWTLPMFHCNGWCFPWTITANAGTHVCLRKVEASAIFNALSNEGVTHFCGAPIVLNMLANADEATRAKARPDVKAFTAGAAPAASIIKSVEEMGIEITHVYGLTEVYGPVVVCEAQSDWNDLDADELAVRKARQGVRYAVQENMEVLHTETGHPVPADGETMGEIVLRGNIVMKGYLKNPKATDAAFNNGWYHTGDLAVRHPDGYVEIKDRLKDIIISGGENVSTIEVESILYQHPDVLDAAVVAEPSERWGETVCAFVEAKAGSDVSDDEIIEFCRTRIAGYKRPRRVVFGPLPKTSTGKIQKFVLRQKASDLAQQPA